MVNHWITLGFAISAILYRRAEGVNYNASLNIRYNVNAENASDSHLADLQLCKMFPVVCSIVINCTYPGNNTTVKPVPHSTSTSSSTSSSTTTSNTTTTTTTSPDDELKKLEDKARKYIEDLEKAEEEISRRLSHFQWEYAVNVNDETKKKEEETSMEFQNFHVKAHNDTISFPWQTFKNETLKRIFKKYSQLGTLALPPDDYKKLKVVINKMKRIYATGKVCSYDDLESECNIPLEPDLSEIFKTNRNAEKLKFYWGQWRDVTGRKCKNLYRTYVNLLNKASRLNNYTNTEEAWLDTFEAKDFARTIDRIWSEVKPLYVELHAYVRAKLRNFYGDKVIKEANSPIPAHILGNMWAQEWTGIYDLTAPYSDRETLDVTEEMVKKNYTVRKMVEVSEEFFTSLNFSRLPEQFWKHSVFEKPSGQEMQCHASAWDMNNGTDFRMKLCATVNMVDFTTIHHEMGHVQYYMEYRHLPRAFREGANPGFHEAVGDTIALSVLTPKHLKTLGLLSNDFNYDQKGRINFLFMMALKKIAFLPFGLLLDKWRWKVFNGSTVSDEYNCEWWKLREQLQGVQPPLFRSSIDFDPAAKFHVPADVSYLRYFVSVIIQYQFHRSLCILANEYNPFSTEKPLANCDIYRNVDAGNAFRKMLALGSSKPWEEVLETLTHIRQLDTSAILEYFDPLYTWLKEYNRNNNITVGWKTDQILHYLPNCIFDEPPE